MTVGNQEIGAVEELEGLEQRRVGFDEAVAANTTRNFVGLALHDILQRLGWIFKMESLVMSTFAMLLGATPAVLGLFPFISRIGKFVTQMVAGEMTAPLRRKMGPVLIANLFFGSAWLGFGLFLLWYGKSAVWMKWGFLAVYALTWFSLGVIMVGISTLKGKLIRSNLRGRLMAVSMFVGGTIALGLVYVLHHIMKREGSFITNFGIIFTIAGSLFLLSCLGYLMMREPPLEPSLSEKPGFGSFVRSARELMTQNANFRRIVGIQFLQNLQWTCLMFYASFGKECMGTASWKTKVAVFLLTQSLSQTLSSISAGWVADKLGNRFVIRILAIVLAILPLTAAGVSTLVTPDTPMRWIPVFILIGMVLPLMQISQNYLLEVTPMERHSSCLGIANGMMAATCVTTLIVGPLIQAIGHQVVFIGMGILMLGAVYFSIRLGEPRFKGESCTTQPGPMP